MAAHGLPTGAASTPNQPTFPTIIPVSAKGVIHPGSRIDAGKLTFDWRFKLGG